MTIIATGIDLAKNVFAPCWCNGDDVDFTLTVQIHQRELKRPVYESSSLVLVLRPNLWCSCRLPLGGVDCPVVPICQPSRVPMAM